MFNRSYDYDAADRLTREIDNIGVSLWAYDLNSNRTSAKLGSSTYPYGYSAASNRLLSVAGPVPKTYTYDAAGNPVSDGTTSFTYNAAGRLSEAARKGHGKPRINAYLYNALGQRIVKDGAYLSNGPYVFLYDEAGHLIGEYDSDNQVRQETVWLEDTPVAVLKQDAQGQMKAYYVHADHLNTPRAILDSQNRMVWRWVGDAFGQALPEEEPDGDGTLFEYNLRLPGQYYDRETGLHYNYFRDYDPSTGRYVESDPIGLEGGMNTYSYVEGNPISRVDPLGLMGGGAGPFPGRGQGPFGPVCGSEGSAAANWIPDVSVEACKKHDDCYDRCARVCGGLACKLQCDGELAGALPLYGLATALGGGSTYDSLLKKYGCDKCTK